MLKGFHLVVAIAALIAVLYIRSSICDDCLKPGGLWGGDNPNYMYYCDPTTNQSASVNCTPESGYVSDGNVSGCVPWEDWDDNCVNKVSPADLVCNGTALVQPQAIYNPNMFALCISADEPPAILDCPEGYGFYAQNKYLGCFPWAMWRNITGCILVQ